MPALSLLEQLCNQAIALNRQALTLLQTTPLPASAVHDCRVTAKQLRAQWQLLRPWLCRDDHKIYDRTLRNGARALAGARDQWVMAGTLHKLARKADKSRRKSLLRIEQTLFADSTEHPGIQNQAQAVDAFQADLARWQNLTLTISDHELLSSGLARSYKQCRNRTIRALGGAEVEPWHALRKWVKYLAYQQQALEQLGLSVALDHHALTDLGKRLGKLHDLHMLNQFLLTQGETQIRNKDRNAALETLHERQARLLRKCQASSQALFQEPTRKWARALTPGRLNG